MGRNGGYTQHRFYLGRDKHQAQIACARLEALWTNVEARWEKTRDCERPVWDDNTLAMAKSIIDGDKETPASPPKIVSGADQALDTELLGIWFARLVRDFPGVNLTLDDADLKAGIAGLAAGFQAKAERLKVAGKSRETLHQALDAYKVWVHCRRTPT